MKEFFMELWSTIVNYYMIYSDFIHSIFRAQVGDLVEGLIDLGVVVAIVLAVARFAFASREN